MAKASTSAILGTVAGRVGDVVLVHVRGGQVVRSRPTYKRHQTDAQKAANNRMRQAMEVWNGFGPAEARAWNAYAATIVRHDSITGETYLPTGHCIFTALAARVRQIDPDAAIPTSPPTSGFSGDSLGVTAEPAPGAIVFTASAPNSPGVVTELLLQKLPNARRTPTSRYTSAAFVAFAAGSLTHTLTVAPGAYAAAYRTSLAATGQTSLLQTLDVAIVPG